MSYISAFDPSADKKRNLASKIYDISESVTKFFWDDAPRLGIQQREGQQDMAFDVLDAIKSGSHVVIEAGVGIGKSFAYLVPILLYNAKTFSPVVIATSTIALQEQLLSDVERLKKWLRIEPDLILAKGKNHYLCLRRASEYFQSVDGSAQAQIISDIRAGHQDRRSFTQHIPDAVWDKINITRFSKSECATCKYADDCQYYNMRIALRYTRGVIVCNQDLLSAHLLLRNQGQDGLLNNEVKLVVIDEAHHLEEKVRSATTTQCWQRQIIKTIYAAEKAIWPTERQYVAGKISSTVHDIKALYRHLSDQMQQQIDGADRTVRDSERLFLREHVHTASLVQKASQSLVELSDSIQIYADMRRRNRNRVSVDDLEILAESFYVLATSWEEQLVWLERRGPYTQLTWCPKDTSTIINNLFFSASIQTILTSATLTNTQDGELEEQYSYFVRSTGFPLGDAGMLAEPKPSPYLYDEHALIYYCNDLPHPTKEREEFIQQGVERLIQLLEISHGMALVLFTAKTDMEDVYAALQGRDLPYKILIQQSGASQEKVLREFREDANSVLLGTGAYWEGISIEGKSLSHVIIFRLPFPVPDPVIDYKASIATDPLMEVSVPEMIIHLKQGIGRLIRNETDTGIISIIDRRLRDDPPERYHDIVWDALPIHNRTVDLQVVREFYDGVCKVI